MRDIPTKELAFYALMAFFTIATFVLIFMENQYAELLLGAWLVLVTDARKSFFDAGASTEDTFEMPDQRVD